MFIVDMIKYHRAPDIEERVRKISNVLELNHLDLARIICVRSRGSASRRTLARCHALPRIMQHALGIEPHYVIEIISEQFDKLNEEEKIKTLLHELLHIPKAFGGGFKFHGYVNKARVEKMYKDYLSRIN